MSNFQQTIPIRQIHFDSENPRIKASLMKYPDKIHDDRIGFALRSSMSDSAEGTSNYLALKESIRAAGGISIPITVVKKNDSYLCIDGNTRLWIYRELLSDECPGNWSEIKAQILDNPSQTAIETIRITAHLVGAREWPAYEKAGFLHKLYYDALMQTEQLIAMCGGNSKRIHDQIEAYSDMNKYYREPNPDDRFKMDRFTGFVELQKKGIKEAIFDAGLELEDFGNWIRDGQIYKLHDVRLLPRVLASEEAKKIFLNGGVRSIEEAYKSLEFSQRFAEGAPPSRSGSTKLGPLAASLLEEIDKLPRSEFIALRDKSDNRASDTVNALAALIEPLQRLVEDVGE